MLIQLTSMSNSQIVSRVADKIEILSTILLISSEEYLKCELENSKNLLEDFCYKDLLKHNMRI